MSNPQPNPSPANRRRDPVTKFREAYAAALVDAQVQADHTATDGWQRLYASQLKAQRERRRKIAGELRSLAELVEAGLLDEDGVKSIGSAKSDCVALNAETAAFDRQTVAPVRETVVSCDTVVQDSIQSARMEEERSPLTNTGLEELMRMAVAEVERPRWNAETGVVRIEQPRAS